MGRVVQDDFVARIARDAIECRFDDMPRAFEHLHEAPARVDEQPCQPLHLVARPRQREQPVEIGRGELAPRTARIQALLHDIPTGFKLPS